MACGPGRSSVFLTFASLRVTQRLALRGRSPTVYPVTEGQTDQPQKPKGWQCRLKRHFHE